MKRLNFIISVIILYVYLQACSSKEHENSIKIGQSFQVVATDSLIVKDILTSLFLFQNVSDDYVFFRNPSMSKVFVFDRNGNLVYDWEKEGDVPGAFSMVAENLSLTKDGNIVVSDLLSGLRVFSPQGDLILQKRVFQNQISISGTINLFKRNQFIEKDGASYLLHHLDLMDESREQNLTFYQNRKNLLVTDLESGETKNILPFPVGSKFLSGKAFPFEDMRPVFHFDEIESKLYLIYQNEPILYTYNWTDDEPKLIEVLSLELEDFYEHDGWEFKAVPFGTMNSRQLKSPFASEILSLDKIDNRLLITYKPGPAPDQRISWERVNKGEGDESLKSKVIEAAKERSVIIQNGEVFPISLPPMYYDSYRVIDNKIWWMKKLSKDIEDESYIVYSGNLRTN